MSFLDKVFNRKPKFKWKDNSSKKITFYRVYALTEETIKLGSTALKDYTPEQYKLFNHPLTIVTSKEEYLQFATAYLRKKYASHYEAWCDLRKLNPIMMENFDTYRKSCIDPTDPSNRFYVLEWIVSASHVCSFIRRDLLVPCYGANYESTSEILLYLAYQEHLNKQNNSQDKGSE